MKFSTKLTSGIAAASAAALGVGLLAFTPGLTAAFSDTDTADAIINVGEFGCAFEPSKDKRVTWRSDNTVLVSLDDIQNSAPGTSTAPVRVKNNGTMALVASFTSTVDSSSSRFRGADVDPVVVPAGSTRNVDLGIAWTELYNGDLGVSATATYTMTCREAAPEAHGFSLRSDGGPMEYNAATQRVTLGVGSSATGGAAIVISNPSASLPANEPTFNADNFRPGGSHPGSLRYYIKFSDGNYLSGFPSEPSHGYWIAPGSGVTGHLNWADVSWHFSGKTVVDVRILMDNSWKGYETDITCVNYSGTPLFGSC